jgi:small-conductance mechanosensitive channel
MRIAAKPLRAFVVWGILLIGANAALQGLEYVSDRPMLATWATRGFAIAWITLAIYVSTKVTNAYFYFADRGAHVEPEYRNRSTVLRKLTIGVIIVIGLLLALRIGGLDIGPLLAGGAVGGVIIGLALQGSLSNVFAGLLLTLDGNVRVGELLRFSDGVTGTLENVGWRSCSLKLLDSTILVIPNSEFSRDRFVNLSRPTAVTMTHLECGVPYSADLDRVEDVVLEVALTVQQKYGADYALAQPRVRWRRFADGAIIFTVLFEVGDPSLQALLSSDLLKALHGRFRNEGIEISIKP